MLVKLKTKSLEIIKRLVSFADFAIWFIFEKEKNFSQRDIPKKLLVILINQEKGNIGGDFATLGVMNRLKKEYPKIEITFLSDKKTIQQLGESGRIKTIEYTGKNTLKLIRKKNFNAALFLTPNKLKPQDFTCISQRIGYTQFGIVGFFRKKKLGYTKKIYNGMSEHMVSLRFKMLEELGFSFKEKTPLLYITEKEKKPVKAFLKKNKIKKYIIMHPGGKYVAESYKKGRWAPHLWNLERYAQVADNFIKKRYNIILTGSKEEEIIAQEIIKNTQQKEKIKSVCGEFSIQETKELLKEAKLLIATDTSIIHIAYQEPIKTKIVELMGPSIPEKVGAWPLNDKRHRILIDKGPYERSMRKIPLKNNYNCLQNIKAEQVISAAEVLLKLNESPASR